MGSKTISGNAEETTLWLTGALVGAMAAGILYQSPAAANEITTAPGGVVEEITVTATRRETSVLDANYNLSAVGGQQLEQQRIIDTISLAKTVSGLTAIDQGNRAGSLMIMRGANLDAINTTDLLINNGDTVGTFYGETPIYIDPLLIDVDRVEVLRGPQGTLFGGRSLGGTLRYMPAQPDAQNFSVDVHGRAYAIDESSGGGFLGDVTLNAPIIDDVLAFRGTVAYLAEDGFIDYNYLLADPGNSDPEDPDDLTSKKDANTQDVGLLRLALLWNMTDNWSGTLAYTYQNRDVGGRQANNMDSYNTGKYESAYRYEEPNERKHQIFNLTINGDVGFGDFLSTTSYSQYDEKGQRDQTDWWLYNADLGFIFGADITDWDELSSYTQELVDETIFTQEFRLVSKADSRVIWLAGLFYQEKKNDNSSTETLPGLSDWWNNTGPNAPLNPPLLDSGPFVDIGYIATGKNKFKETAAFGQIGYWFTDQFQATVGGRYFKTDQDIDLCFFYEPVKGVNAFLECDTGGGNVDDAIFMFNTSYDFSETNKLYFTISEGYGDGGENPVAVCDDLQNPTPPCIAPGEKKVNPETVTNYELGWRTQWLDNKLQVLTAIYQMDWDNIQIDTISSGDDQTIIAKNGGKALTYGLEAEATYLINEYWAVSGGYAYTHAQINEDLEAGQLYPEEVKEGDRLPGSPRHKANVFVGFNYPFSNGLRFKADYLVTAQSDIFTKVGIGNECCRDNGEKFDSFAVHNLGLGIAGRTWEARLFADNLLNEYAETGVRKDTSWIQGNGFGIENFWPDPKIQRDYYKNMIRPRTIGIDFRWRFNGN